MTHERALSILIENAGMQFDPQIVEIFTNIPREGLAGQSALHEIPGKVEGLAVLEAGSCRPGPESQVPPIPVVSL